MRSTFGLLVLLLLACSADFAHADELAAINTFLLASPVDSAKTPDIPSPTGVGAWIEDAQFRFNTADDVSDKDRNAQSYALRVKPKAWGQRDAEEKILTLRSQQEDAQSRQSLNDELSHRYKLILELISQHNQIRYLLDTEALLGKQLELNRNLVNSADFNPENLLATEVAFDQNQDALEMAVEQLHDLQKRLHLPETPANTLADTETTWNWLINVPQMQELMAQTSASEQTPGVLSSRLDVKTVEAENQRRKTTQQLGVNLLRFQIDDTENRDPKLGFMIGVNIPLGSGNYQSAAGSHDLNEAHLKLQHQLLNTQHDLVEKRERMKWLVKEWQMTHRQTLKIQERQQQAYAQLNPQLSLSLQQERLKKQKTLQEIQQKALTVYIDYLTLTGLLSCPPLSNWLHNTPELHTLKTAFETDLPNTPN